MVVEELIPKMSQGQHSNVGTVFFAVGFSVMMVLDVALGVMVGGRTVSYTHLDVYKRQIYEPQGVLLRVV